MAGLVTVTVDPDSDGRDARGRFAPGNRHGAGDALLRRIHELRRRVVEALEDEVEAVLAALVRQAVAGDVAAAKVLLERGLGAPRKEPPEPLQLDLGPVDDLEAVAKASARLVDAVAAGQLDTDRAEALQAVLARHRAAVEAAALVDLEARLTVLEARR